LFNFNLDFFAEFWDNIVRVGDVVFSLHETYAIVDVKVDIFVVVVDLWGLSNGLLFSGHSHHFDFQFVGIILCLLLVGEVRSILLILNLPPVWRVGLDLVPCQLDGHTVVKLSLVDGIVVLLWNVLILLGSGGLLLPLFLGDFFIIKVVL